MIISRKRQPALPTTFIKITGSQMEHVNSYIYRYLGIWLTSILNWSFQRSTCKKARRQLGFVYRKFYRHGNKYTLATVTISGIVSPYVVAVWDPHHRGM